MPLNLSILSKYRTQLMGLAMLWVVFFHMKISVHPILFQIKAIGYAGVDIFLFISGIGMVFSLQNNKSIKEFYKRRCLRILPAYILITLFFGLIGYFKGYCSMTTILYSLSGFDIITERFTFLTRWFIPFILFLYIITPWYLKLFERKIGKGTIAIFTIIILYCIIQNIVEFNHWTLYISRIPIYFLGIYVGMLIKKNTVINRKELILSCLLMVIGFIIIYYSYYNIEPTLVWSKGLLWYPFVLIIFPLCLILCRLFEVFPNYKYPILSFIGKYSLTIYLLHGYVLSILSNKLSPNNLFVNIFAVVITIICSYFIQNGINFFIKKILKE